MLEEIVVKMSEDLKSQNLKSFYNDFLNKLRLDTESTIQYLRGIEKSQKNIEEEIIKNETLPINENLEENESNLENKYFEFKHIKVMELNEKYEKLKENMRAFYTSSNKSCSSIVENQVCVAKNYNAYYRVQIIEISNYKVK